MTMFSTRSIVTLLVLGTLLIDASAGTINRGEKEEGHRTRRAGKKYKGNNGPHYIPYQPQTQDQTQSFTVSTDNFEGAYTWLASSYEVDMLIVDIALNGTTGDWTQQDLLNAYFEGVEQWTQSSYGKIIPSDNTRVVTVNLGANYTDRDDMIAAADLVLQTQELDMVNFHHILYKWSASASAAWDTLGPEPIFVQGNALEQFGLRGYSTRKEGCFSGNFNGTDSTAPGAYDQKHETATMLGFHFGLNTADYVTSTNKPRMPHQTGSDGSSLMRNTEDGPFAYTKQRLLLLDWINTNPVTLDGKIRDCMGLIPDASVKTLTSSSDFYNGVATITLSPLNSVNDPYDTERYSLIRLPMDNGGYCNMFGPNEQRMYIEFRSEFGEFNTSGTRDNRNYESDLSSRYLNRVLVKFASPANEAATPCAFSQNNLVATLGDGDSFPLGDVFGDGMSTTMTVAAPPANEDRRRGKGGGGGSHDAFQFVLITFTQSPAPPTPTPLPLPTLFVGGALGPLCAAGYYEGTPGETQSYDFSAANAMECRAEAYGNAEATGWSMNVEPVKYYNYQAPYSSTSTSSLDCTIYVASFTNGCHMLGSFALAAHGSPTWDWRKSALITNSVSARKLTCNIEEDLDDAALLPPPWPDSINFKGGFAMAEMGPANKLCTSGFRWGYPVNINETYAHIYMSPETCRNRAIERGASAWAFKWDYIQNNWDDYCYLYVYPEGYNVTNPDNIGTEDAVGTCPGQSYFWRFGETENVSDACSNFYDGGVCRDEATGTCLPLDVSTYTCPGASYLWRFGETTNVSDACSNHEDGGECWNDADKTCLPMYGGEYVFCDLADGLEVASEKFYNIPCDDATCMCPQIYSENNYDPDMDICSQCTARVLTASSPHNSCDDWCTAKGLVCTRAFDDFDEDCVATKDFGCDMKFSNLFAGDALCECGGGPIPTESLPTTCGGDDGESCDCDATDGSQDPFYIGTCGGCSVEIAYQPPACPGDSVFHYLDACPNDVDDDDDGGECYDEATQKCLPVNESPTSTCNNYCGQRGRFCTRGFAARSNTGVCDKSDYVEEGYYFCRQATTRDGCEAASYHEGDCVWNVNRTCDFYSEDGCNVNFKESFNSYSMICDCSGGHKPQACDRLQLVWEQFANGTTRGSLAFATSASLGTATYQDGWTLKMSWPGHDSLQPDAVSTTKPYVIWTQTNDPSTSTAVTGFNLLHEYWGENVESTFATPLFTGLCTSSSDLAEIDGTCGQRNWYFATGGSAVWTSGVYDKTGIPAFSRTPANHVQVEICVDCSLPDAQC